MRLLPLVPAVLLAAAACAGRSAAPGAGTYAAADPATQYAIAYTVAMPDPASHLYEVTIALGGLRGDSLVLELPVWSPGRYARMDFARNVQDFSARTGPGPVPWAKSGGSRWSVALGGSAEATVRYRVYANDLSGTFSVLDTAHANWNGAGLFMYVAGHKADPVSLYVVSPPGWAVYNGAGGGEGDEGGTVLGSLGAPDGTRTTRYRFPNYDLLVDTPTEVAPAAALMVDSFTVDGRRYRSVVHHNGPASAASRARFVDELRRIVLHQNRVVEPPPLRTYTFLFNIGYAGGDGMEHLYSTQVINARPWADTAAVLPGISTGSHEYFHTWNVKRIRPAVLGPFDYTESQHQPSLWVAEGWTQYYGDMTLHRAGVVPKERLYATIGRIVQLTSQSPARKERSPRAASFDAPFFDGADAPMRTNEPATFITYYYSGESRALALDLLIRANTQGQRSLDDVLRRLKAATWDQPRATYYLPGRGYTEQDVERAASEVMGRDMAPWFARHVGGTEDLPWAEILGVAGLALEGATLVERPDATPAQRLVREGWLRGAGAATP